MRNIALISGLVIAGLVVIIPLIISYIVRDKDKIDREKYEDMIHDEKDKTEEQREIHRRAGLSEYTLRGEMDAGLYA
jgi:hypothetical protein